MSTPSFGAADERETLRWLGGALVQVVLPATAAGGDVSVVEILAGAGYSAARHTHAVEDEVFVVLAGGVTVVAGDLERRMSPGGRVFLPRGVPHGYRVDAGPARILNICVPGGIDGFFREVAAGLDLEAVATRYGITYG